eukprot:338302_1
MRSFAVIVLLITICHGLIFDVLKRNDRFQAFVTKYSGENNNLKLQGVPNCTVCNPSGVVPHFKWTNFTITPNNLTSNEEIHVTGNGTLDEDITGGNVAINIYVNGINIFNDQEDLCSVAPYAGLDCPVKAGPVYMDETEELPFGVPGTYKVRVNITDMNNQEITCIQIVTTLT